MAHDAVAQRVARPGAAWRATRRGRSGTGSTRASCAWATRSAGGSGCSMHSTPNSARRLSTATSASPGAVGAVGVDLEHEVGMVRPHGAHRLDLPAGLDLQPHAGPRRPAPTASTSAAQRSPGRGPRGCRRRRRRAWPRTRPRLRGRRPGSAPRPAARRPPPPSRRRPPASGRPASSRRAAPPPPRRGAGRPGRRAALARRGTPRSTAARSTSSRAGRPRCRPPRAAHSPQPSPSSATTRTKSSGRSAVHAGAVPMLLAERDVDADQLDAAELHGTGALPRRHRRSQLVRSSVPARMAEWQTRRPQKPLSERACGFESRSGHDVFAGNRSERRRESVKWHRLEMAQIGGSSDSGGVAP